ncbi:hypothetical protein E4U43_002100 [Claviceps pusilla]|uniref:Uncharacterized protein n=1 Tax=Claviceps pusilla TaxID=123648 RepID=A0A9P7N9B1_9HYPO|nr:hypothetical protein E4U43_002100 [Claviceps pusilla]
MSKYGGRERIMIQIMDAVDMVIIHQMFPILGINSTHDILARTVRRKHRTTGIERMLLCSINPSKS